MSKVKKNKIIKELEETLIKKGVEIDGISDVLKKIENNLKDKKYGLVWEEHTEEIEKELLTKFPILKEEKELRVFSTEEGLTNNFLIEGDNLESLTALKNMGKKVDVIEVDPPYNLAVTGRDGALIYNDRRIDIEDTYRHSKWLSFMEVRLKLARDLLTEDGVIFIHIDDNEQANLKILCDEIFGEENLLSNLVWYKGYGKNDSHFFSNSIEYILCYSKNVKKMREQGVRFKMEKEGYQEVKNLVDKGVKRGKTEEEIENEVRKFYRNSKGLKGVKNYNKVEKGTYRVYRGVTLENPNIKNGYYYTVKHPKTGEAIKTPKKGYNRPKSSLDKLIENGEIIYGKDHTTLINRKYYLDEMRMETPKNLMINSKQGGTELDSIFGKKTFSYPKHSDLIKDVIRLYPDKCVTVLDFFAGSGTTGHAVLELNKEDGGNRNFILCTNNENNICRDVTYQRLNKVINGYTTTKGKEVEGIPANLTYLKTELVGKEEDLVDFGVSEDIYESMINTLKVLHNLSTEDALNAHLTKLVGENKDFYLYDNFYIDSDDFEGIELDSNKTNVVYVKEENLTDVVLNRFDEVISLEDLVRY